jgi:5-methylcytosine-specific restriction protein B
MNTADRSIALVDVALRRRFAFVDLPPSRSVIEQFNRDNLTVPERRANLLRAFDLLNGDPADPDSGVIRDPRYRLGHSYFLHSHPEDLDASVRTQVLPLLDEYRREGILSDGDDLGEALKLLRDE